jgi:hypothetical protein
VGAFLPSPLPAPVCDRSSRAHQREPGWKILPSSVNQFWTRRWPLCPGPEKVAELAAVVELIREADPSTSRQPQTLTLNGQFRGTGQDD